MNHCFMSYKHKALKSVAPKRQFCGSASYTKADSEGKGLQEMTNCLSYNPVAINFAWLWWSPMASEALSYGLNLKIFPGGACPQTPLERFICANKMACDACATWPHQPLPYVCPPPLLQSLDPPLLLVYKVKHACVCVCLDDVVGLGVELFGANFMRRL